MLLNILKSSLIPLFICIKLHVNHGAIIPPVLLSSMRNDIILNNGSLESDKHMNNFSSLPNNSFENVENSLTSTTDSFVTFTSISDSKETTPVNILPSFETKVFNTASVYLNTTTESSNLGTIKLDDSFSESFHNATLSSQHKNTINVFQTVSKTPNVVDTKDLESSEGTSQSFIEISSLSFHTPLMSLLIASPSIPMSPHKETASHYLPYSSIVDHTMTATYNESANHELTNSNEHKKLLMLVLRAEDCSKLSKEDFEKMLEKLMTKFGFEKAVPEVSNARCFSHLHINLTIGGQSPSLRFLPNIDDKNNVTVDVLNRTFRVVKLEKIDLKLEKPKPSYNSSNVIMSVAEHESIAYISVGVTFGLILVICFVMCCIKCCYLRKSKKRFSSATKGAHVRLRPEDYTLTPIPRPTSLYADYYRASLAADIYSTTSAGSIASTTPTVDQGIIQPFDTSIVPLEDSSTSQVDHSRDPSVESAPLQSNMKTFNIHDITGKGIRHTSTDSKEQLNPKQSSRKAVTKGAGVANPTFQRY